MLHTKEKQGNKTVRKKHNSLKHVDMGIVSQVILTYGTMITILIFLIVLKVVLSDKELKSFDVWGMAVGAFSPTTITFIACLVQTDEQIRKNRLNASILHFLVIFMSLAYITFEAINTAEKDIPTVVFGFIGIVVPIAAVYILCDTSSHAEKNDRTRQSSDGCISAQMEVLR